MKMTERIQGIVDRLGTECFEAHRGAFWWEKEQRIAIAFGNDGGEGGEDERAQYEVAALRVLLAAEGGKELAFARDSQHGYSWALACELPAGLNPDLLERALWAAWNAASGRRVQVEEGANPPPLTLDPDGVRKVLNWDHIRDCLANRKFGSVGAAFTGYQANIARAVLERNGLLCE